VSDNAAAPAMAAALGNTVSAAPTTTATNSGGSRTAAGASASDGHAPQNAGPSTRDSRASPNANDSRALNIVGAGLAGALLAALLARRGYKITLYDRRPDPRHATAAGGRSINLALAARGIQALERAGVMDRISPLLIPMRGRMVHDLSGSATLQPYGQREHEVIYSVGRAALNRVLIEEAARYHTVTMRFDQTCLAASTKHDTLRLRNNADDSEYETPLTPTIATDGAGSAVRTSLAKTHHVAVREDWLDHDYKELTIPAATARHVLDANSLHIWPRGGFMLIALPNTDGSFTATLFLTRTGANSFATLTNATAVTEFFRREFPDVVPLMPNLAHEFLAHPQGQLGTVHLAPWHVGGSVLLLGDAAHAIVPFHGQGMNAAFEDCSVLDTLLDNHGAPTNWEPLFDELSRSRRPNAAAIAEMALENYTEMRDTVLDAAFVRRKAIAMELERRFPTRFIPRYSMVMFHPEIPYADALRRGAIQAEILTELDTKRDASGNTNATLAEQLINERLAPVG
jgi:kynurenine 3-monooxygenase